MSPLHTQRTVAPKLGSIDLLCALDIEYARRKLTIQFYKAWQNALRHGLGIG